MYFEGNVLKATLLFGRWNTTTAQHGISQMRKLIFGAIVSTHRKCIFSMEVSKFHAIILVVLFGFSIFDYIKWQFFRKNRKGEQRNCFLNGTWGALLIISHTQYI